MTGAGAATVAFTKEDSHLTETATPTYFQPGRNIQIQDIELSRLLNRMRDPDEVEPAESIAGRIEGAFSAEWVMTQGIHDDVRDIIFNSSGTSFTSGAAATSRWYTGVDYLSGTAERVLKGVIPQSYEIRYDNDTNTVRESLTAFYTDEDTNTSITPGSTTGPTGGDSVTFHGFSLSIDSTTAAKLQSATLSWSNIARPQFGASATAVDAVIANPEPELQTEAIFDDTSHLELAYGSSGSTTPQDSMSSVSGSMTFDVGGTTIATYTLPRLKPDTYTWNDLVNGENDLTEPVTWHVNGGVSIS